jgi:hypothetical protein
LLARVGVAADVETAIGGARSHLGAGGQEVVEHGVHGSLAARDDAARHQHRVPGLEAEVGVQAAGQAPQGAAGLALGARGGIDDGAPR